MNPLRLLSQGTPRRLGSADRLISVLLPIKNRAANAAELLARVFSQRWNGSLEVIAVDSGSTDDTVDVLARGGATVLGIAPELFDYGLTRNEAARHAKGDVFVFVTSTMLPANDRWLANLIEAYDSDDLLAGVYARSIPHPEADPLHYRDYLLADVRTNRREALTIQNGLYVRAIVDFASFRSFTPDRVRHLISFSNVSAAIRPGVFRSIPFRQVETCGEDMLWAREVLEAGYKIGYSTRSIVLYSHNYSWTELFQRSYDDAGGNIAFAGMRFRDEDVFRAIAGLVRNDWNYLAIGLALQGTELIRWKIESVKRRVSQVVGEWAGNKRTEIPARLDALVNAVEALPGGESPTRHTGGRRESSRDELTDVSYGKLFARAFRRAAEFGSPGLRLSELEPSIADGILADWKELEARPEPENVAELQLDAAIRRFMKAVGHWVGSYTNDCSADLSDSLSLLRSIKRGVRTREMTVPHDLRREKTRPDEVDDWLPVLRMFQACEAEILADEHELHARGEAFQALQKEIDTRDALIRKMQKEFFRTVEDRDVAIRSLQLEMHEKVAECNRIIRELQGRIAEKGRPG
ncbi:MAG TPA: glycosyltransferase [Thermoanaerobaculia bacterium]|nr:glycosyltransferase [Thermoanaerobaculia bacterium]